MPHGRDFDGPVFLGGLRTAAISSRALCLSVLAIVGLTGPLSAETFTVPPGPRVQYELQERLIGSRPGDVIQLEEGRYEFRGELNLVCQGVTLRGRGPDKTILSFADQQAGSDGLLATGDRFLFEDFAIENTAGNGIKVLGGKEVTFRRLRVEWTEGPKPTNGAYGIYPVECSDVLIEECVAIAAADAGIYVGQCDRVIVRRCRAERNVTGIEIENTFHADVHDNVATNNTGGILVFDLPGLPVAGGGSVRVFHNDIRGNNHPNFAPPGNMVSDVPAGTGMMMLAANDVEAFDNDIVDHNTANVLIVSFLVTDRPYDPQRYDPYSEAIFLHDNRIARGGMKPGGQLGRLVSPLVGGKFADIVTDGAVNPDKAVEGELPESRRIRLQNNGEVSFLNFNLARLNPKDILAGRYRFERNAKLWDGTLPPLPAIELRRSPVAPADNPAVAVYRAAPQRLSEWKLFDGVPGDLKPARGLLAYDLNTPLFSDYTTKARWIRLPEGKPIEYRADGVFDFPVGTVMAKTFAMPEELGRPDAKAKLLETRIQLRNEAGWYGFSYRWNDEQTEAELSLGGGACDVAWTHSDAEPRTNHYEIPNANQCLSCHSQSGAYAPLGPTAANLNREIVAGGAAADPARKDRSRNQLQRWSEAGLLVSLPPIESVPRMPRFDDPGSGPLAGRARAWLDVNCAHCHRPEGTARTAGLDLRASQRDPLQFGVMKTPVAAGRGSGGRKFDIVPGKPEESILLFRIESTRPGMRMPNLARNVVHREGVDLIRAWIESMDQAEKP